ncbi:MAG: hypothetical protein ACYC7D_14270 [Nitrososphaerales archaeon]
MRRAFVSLPDGIWDILDRDFKGQIGEGDSEVIRNVVISYLSDRGYFVNEKGAPVVDEFQTKLQVMENMITALTEVLEEKGEITYSEWENRVKKKLSNKDGKGK